MIAHRVTTSDSITALAVRYLGDARRWRELVATNELRPPYISANPRDQWGGVVASYTLAQAITPGQRTITITTLPALVDVGSVVGLIRHTTDGTLVARSAVVESIDGTAMTVQAPLDVMFPISTIITIHPPAAALRGMVAQPGDLLTIQADAIPAISTVATPTADPYLRDLSCNDLGQLSLTTAGDIATVGGGDNLRQQIAHRLRTPPGALPAHPTYGCSAVDYIGQASLPAVHQLIQAATALALAADSRVARVESVESQVVADRVTVLARVHAVADATPITLAVRLQ